MFGKKKCKNCNEKIGNDYNFCPHCGMPFNEDSDGKDWGFLGKKDNLDNLKFPMGSGFSNLFSSLLNSLNEELKDVEPQPRISGESNGKKVNMKKGGISISISTSGNRPPEIKVTSFGNSPELKDKEEMKRKKKFVNVSPSDPRKFSGLPKKEPETNIRRLSSKVVYEINIPGVKSLEDISIMQLENSIEIKALGKDKVFQKIIPINLPIRDYNLSKGKLVLELDARE